MVELLKKLTKSFIGTEISILNIFFRYGWIGVLLLLIN